MCPSDSGSIRSCPVLHGASDHSLKSRGTKTTILLTKRILHLPTMTYVVSTYDKNNFRSFWPKIWPFWIVRNMGSESRESLDKINYSVFLHCTRYPLAQEDLETSCSTLLCLTLSHWGNPRGFHTYSSGPKSVLDLHPYLSELQISP